MAEVKLNVNETKLTVLSPRSLVGTGVNYDICRFNFGTEWEGYVKNAVFYSSENTNPIVMLINEDNTCYIPWESIEKPGILYIGVFGIKDNVEIPTNFVELKLIQGAAGNNAPPPPSLSVYKQFLDKVNEVKEIEDSFKSAEIERTLNEEERQKTYLEFKGDITQGTGLNNELKEHISTGNELDIKLKEDIDLGNTLKIDLKKDIELANISKTELSGVTEEAKQVKVETEQLIQTGGAATKGDIDKVNSSLEHITQNVEFFGAIGDGNFDNTQIIQALLDRKGVVKITKAGVYITKTLYIDDDTELILGKDVYLKLKDGTGDYLIVNKGSLNNTFNKNIKINGGNFDFNKNSNSSNTNWKGIGIKLNRVRNLSIKNINYCGNAWKYCFIMANIINGEYDNIHFENNSDGLHFQAPCKNLSIKNIDGYTHDNMVAFTIGDYTAYTISEDGDFEDIDISNITIDEGQETREFVRFVGAGKSNIGEIRNVTISNLKGKMLGDVAINILGQDITDGNLYLKKTIVKNIVIKNINWNSEDYSNLINISSKSEVDFIKMENIVCDDYTLSNKRKSMINATSDVIIKNVSMKNIKYHINSSVNSFLFENTQNAIDFVNISDSDISINKGFVYSCSPSGGVYKNQFVNIKSSNITSEKIALITGQSTLSIDSSNVSVSAIAFSLGGSGKAILNTNSNTFNGNNLFKFSDINIANNTSISINGSDFPFNDTLSKINNPKNGDIVNVVSTGEPYGIGIFQYFNGSFSKINSSVLYSSSSRPNLARFKKGQIVYNSTVGIGSYLGWVALNDGFACENQWNTGNNVTVGVYKFYGSNVYIATTSGTTGGTAPTGTGTNISDGGVTWNFYDYKVNFGSFGKIE